ncbi:MAG: DUF488 domain-containing protein [Chloroflexota bacterium]
MTNESNSTDSTIPIYTIGYGQRTMDEFIDLLTRYEIAFLVDVRTAPYSRYKPEYSKTELELTLREAGIRYIFLGNSLGGRPDAPDCYRNGKIDYEAVKTKGFYQKGLERVHAAFAQQQRIVLMCSEGKPEMCHRSKLIGASLTQANVPVIHIDENDDPQEQDEIIFRLTKGQLSLFGEEEFTSRKKYRGAQDG